MQKYTCAVETQRFTFLHCITNTPCESVSCIMCKPHAGKSHISVLLAFKGIWLYCDFICGGDTDARTPARVVSPALRDLAVSRRLVKAKMNSDKQTHFKPQHNVRIKF